MRESSTVPTILAVCTGNLHRSPMMETVLRANHGADPTRTIISAGTIARRRHRWPDQTLSTLRAAGYVVTDGRTRRLSRRDVRSARLILTATRAHRIDVLSLDQSAELRCFSLIEAARLIGAAPPSGDGLLADLNRAMENDRGDHEDDLADPIGGTDEDFAECLHAVESAVAVITGRLDRL